MKHLLWLCLLAFGLWASPASAACGGPPVHGGSGHACYAIAVTTNWGTSGMWSNLSAGSSCSCVPASGDDIVFDGSTPAGTYNNTTGITYNSIDATLAPAGVILGGANGVTVTGNFFGLSTAMTYNISGSTTFSSTTGITTITPNGHTFGGLSLTFNGVGGTFRPTTAIIASGTSGIVLTNGTLDVATNNVNVSMTAAGFSGAAGTLNCGSGIWTFAAGFAFSGTISCASATFNFTNTAPAAIRIFATSGSSFGAVTIGPVSSPNIYPEFQISGAGTLASLTITGPATVRPATNTILTLSATPNWTGTASGIIAISGNNNAVTNATLAIPAPTPPAFSWVAMQGITFTGNTAGTCAPCFQDGPVTGMTFAPPSSGGIIGG